MRVIDGWHWVSDTHRCERPYQRDALGASLTRHENHRCRSSLRDEGGANLVTACAVGCNLELSMTTGAFDDVWLAPLTPQSFLDRSAHVFRDKAAAVYGDVRLSYRQLAERVNRLASALRAADIGPADRVAFLCPNT